MKFILTTLATLVACAPLLAQSTLAPTGVDLPAVARPRAIAGTASSARHCVSADAANTHEIGWIELGSTVIVTFESDFSLLAGTTRLDLQGLRSNQFFGNPEVRLTTSTAGTMALFVGGNQASGCYQYKVDIQRPSASTVSVSTPLPPVDASASSAVLVAPSAIAGLASSAQHCISGSFVSNVHDIGRIEEGNRVVISFDSDFNAIAGMTLINLPAQRGSFLINDDGGGSQQPLLNFIAGHGGTLALFVGGVNGAAGCYRYKVEIR